MTKTTNNFPKSQVIKLFDTVIYNPTYFYIYFLYIFKHSKAVLTSLRAFFCPSYELANIRLNISDPIMVSDSCRSQFKLEFACVHMPRKKPSQISLSLIQARLGIYYWSDLVCILCLLVCLNFHNNQKLFGN